MSEAPPALTAARASELAPTVRPEEVGLCPARLGKLAEHLDRDVRDGVMPGVTAVVHRRGEVAWSHTAGQLDSRRGLPMRPDAIFRVYSMTKPLTSLAALSLWEDGRLQLDDPVSRFIPGFGSLSVMSATEGAPPPRRPLEREVTVYDLLRHTAGLADGIRGAQVFRDLYAEAGIRSFDHTDAAYGRTCADLVDRLAGLPLAYQPGTVWEYGIGGDVLGRVVEVAAQAPLGEVLTQRILGPLGMTDTGFHVAPQKADRVAQADSASHPDIALRTLTDAPDYRSGGSGCYSTLPDYLRFTRMLLAGGVLDGHRVASRKTVELMTADHLGAGVRPGPDYIPGPGYGFGLGVAVRRTLGGSFVAGSPGDYWWLGRAGTSFFVDPREELIGIVMMQKYWQARPYQKVFKNLVHQAIAD